MKHFVFVAVLCIGLSGVVVADGRSSDRVRVALARDQINVISPQGVNLSLAIRDRAVVLEFWATWCGPCVGAIPHLNNVIEAVQGRPVLFIAVTDEATEQVRSFLAKHTMKGWVAVDSRGALFKRFGIDARPTSILFDRRGREVTRLHPGTLEAETVEALIAGKLKRGAGERGMASQPSALPPLYQVEIRPSSAPWASGAVGPGLLRGGGETLRELFAKVMGTTPARVVIDDERAGFRYDYSIVVPRDGPDTKLLLHEALTAGFGLNATKESRTQEVLVLTLAPGASEKLARSETTGSSSRTDDKGLHAVGITMNRLAQLFEWMLQTPVVDESGFTNKVDLELELRGPRTLDNVRSAAQAQLGVLLADSERPTETWVVKPIEPPARQ